METPATRNLMDLANGPYAAQHVYTSRAKPPIPVRKFSELSRSLLRINHSHGYSTKLERRGHVAVSKSSQEYEYAGNRICP